jgi:hypothetical protein
LCRFFIFSYCSQVAVTGLGDRFVLAFYDEIEEDISFSIIDLEDNILVSAKDIDTTAGNESRLAIGTIREDEKATQDSFVLVWWDADSSDIKAAAYNKFGLEITAPFTVDTQQDTTYRLLDVAGRDSITGNSLCPGTFAVAYTNSSDQGLFKSYYVNGTEWDGICRVSENTAPTHTAPILNTTFGTNLSNENLTCYNQSTFDNEADNVTSIFTFYRNETSSKLFHLTMDNNLTDIFGDQPTESTGLQFTDGKYGRSTYLPDEADLNYNPAGNINTSQGTIEMWVNAASDIWENGENNYLFRYQIDGDNIIYILADNGNQLQFRYEGQNDAENVNSQVSDAWNANEWHHIAITWNT